MKKSILILVLFVSTAAYSQFEIRGVVRPRAEFRNGYARLRDSLTQPAGFVTQRTRLNLKFKKDFISTYLSFYDFRVWGDQPLKKDLSSVGLNEGWVEIALSEAFAVRFGRMAIGYDNNRLFSKVNWNQIGAAHDMLLLKYRSSGWKIDFGAAYNQDAIHKFGTDYSTLIMNYKTLNYLWLEKRSGNIYAAFTAIADGYQKEGTLNTVYLRYTTGPVVKYKSESWGLEMRGFYQGGQLQTGTKVSAYYLNLNLDVYSIRKFKITGGFELLSGNNACDSLDTKDHAFDILYGSRHKFNGTMDYFSIPLTTKRAGLVNPYFKLKFSLSKKVDIFADYFFFRLFGNYLYDGKFIDKNLGNEIDLKVKAKIANYVRMEGGYSFMLANKSMEALKGGEKSYMNSWAYVMVTVDPVLFTTKKDAKKQ
jgi:hypothetical protein